MPTQSYTAALWRGMPAIGTALCVLPYKYTVDTDLSFISTATSIS
jgi:hypothetical protein